jgi:hypothetical protein
MATFELYPSAVQPTSRNVELLRTLGTLALASSPMVLLAAAASGFGAPSSAIEPLIGFLGFLQGLGWLCSLAGLHLTGAMGRGLLGGRLLGVEAALVAAAAAWAMAEAALPGWNELGFPLALGAAAWPASQLGMLAVGAFVLRAGRWTGWTRWAPLLCGLALPLALLTGGTDPEPATSPAFAFASAASFALLGWAVRTSGPRLRETR